MKILGSRAGLRLLACACACALVTAVGCGGLKVVPVTGKVTLDGKALKGAVVQFNPDKSKGNDLRVSSTGRIGGDGRYELYTDDGSKVRKGAPVGWYKVTFLTGLPGAPAVDIDGKYLDVDKTPLSIEVIDGPKEYDFALTK